MGDLNPDPILRDLHDTDEPAAYVWGLKLAQAFYVRFVDGLEVTGELDNATCTFMSWPRCDRPDLLRIEDFPDVEGLPHSNRGRRKRFTAGNGESL